ncbi:unnamed protein product [Rotaria socialis]
MEFQTKQNEFPSLPQCMSGATPWKLASSQQATTTNINGSEDVTKMLISINQNILDMKEYTHRIDEKLDRNNKSTLLNSFCNCECLSPSPATF